MGKGDRKTRRGKIWRGSFGKTRPKGSAKQNTGETMKEPSLGLRRRVKATCCKVASTRQCSYKRSKEFLRVRCNSPPAVMASDGWRTSARALFAAMRGGQQIRCDSSADGTVRL